MDIVLVGLPGSGKSEVGRRLAEATGATFVDTDREVERLAGRSIAALFRDGGERAFRAHDRAAVERLPDAGREDRAGLVIATGGGTVIDPRNRWQLYVDRFVVWLDAPDEVLAERLARSAVVRPLLAGDDLSGTLERLRRERERYYAGGARVDTSGPITSTVAAIRGLALQGSPLPVALLRADLSIGRVVLGMGIAGAALADELRRTGARRAVIVTEPRAWAAVGGALAAGMAERGLPIETIEVPEGEAAKRLGVVEAVAADLALRGVERGETIVAVGGGALTDVAGFAAATFQRGTPWIAVPTTLLGQLDAAHGGKTAVDIGAGKNLVGAFHLPAAVIVDPSLLATLPERHRRAALAEAVKDGLLDDERLLALLEADGRAIAGGDGLSPSEPSALAELVERAMSVKLRSVEADRLEQGERIALNLGHTFGHAIEAAAGFGPVLHGEAVGYGLRAAARIGRRLDVTPPDRADRIEAILDHLGLATDPLPYPLDEVLSMLWTDKKRRAGALRWVLPTEAGWTLRDDVPDELVREVASAVLAGREIDAHGAAVGAAGGAGRGGLRGAPGAARAAR